MDTRALRLEHSSIMDLASRLGGVVGDIRTRGDAHDARQLIEQIDGLLQGHLRVEDAELYPALIGTEDSSVRELGARALEEMGGIIGAWLEYRDQWTVEAILADVRPFDVGTRGLLGALSLRIEMENDVLYPAMDRLTAGEG